MTIEPHNLNDDALSTRLDALGRSLASEAASPPPPLFLSALHRKRAERTSRKVYAIAAIAAVLLLASLAMYFYPSAVTRGLDDHLGGTRANSTDFLGPASVGALRRSLYDDPDADLPVHGDGLNEPAVTPMINMRTLESDFPRRDR